MAKKVSPRLRDTLLGHTFLANSVHLLLQGILSCSPLTVGSGLPCTMHSSCALSPGAACTNGVSTRTSGGSAKEGTHYFITEIVNCNQAQNPGAILSEEQLEVARNGLNHQASSRGKADRFVCSSATILPPDSGPGRNTALD